MVFSKKKKKKAETIFYADDMPEPVQEGDMISVGPFDGEIRVFASGATRDTDTDKPEYAGFLSSDVLIEFGKYMHEHRIQKDGSLRASDNWKKGIPRSVYIESMFRHFMDIVNLHEHEATLEDVGLPVYDQQLQALMALLFNVQGYTYELLNGR